MGATYKLKHKKADGTIEEVAVPISSVDGLQTALDGKQPSGSYATTNTAQTISGAKTLTNTLKIQSGNPAGAFVLGGNVSSTGLTANTRKLGRMGVPAYTSNGSTVTSTVAGISFDAQANANYADFGGHPRNTSSIAPDVIRFVVADSHDNNVAGNRTLAFQIAKQIVADSVDGATSFAGAKFFVPVEATGTIKATGGFVGDLTGTADDADKLGGQLPAYYLNYNNLTNKPTIPSGSAEPFIVTFTNSGNNNYTVDLTYEDIEQAFANGKIVIGVDSTNSYIYQIFGLSDDDTIPFSRIVNWGENGADVETLFVDTDDSVSYARNTLATTALATATSKGLMSATDKKKVDWLDLDTSDGYIFTIGDDSVTSARIELNNNDNSVNATGEEVYLRSTFGSAYVTSEDDIYLQAEGDIMANGKKVCTANMSVPFIPSDAFTVIAESTYNPTKWSVENVSGITTPTDGLTIAVRTPNDGSGYGIALSIDGGSNYYPIVRNKSTTVSTEYSQGSTLILTFNSTQRVSVLSGSSTSTTVTGCWQFSDSNTMVTQFYTTENNKYPMLFKYVSGITTTAKSTTHTRYANNMYVNPSTGTIYANDFVVDGKSIVGGGSGDVDTFVVNFTWDVSNQIYTTDKTFEETYNKIKEGKAVFANTLTKFIGGTGHIFTVHNCTENQITFARIYGLPENTEDGDPASINIYYIAFHSNNTADLISEYIPFPSSSNGGGVAQLQQSVTYAELKSLRDNGELVPSTQYRITDFVTTTSQPDTQSAGHPFDIIVTALSNTTLSENASADYHKTIGGATFDPSVLADEDGNLVGGSVIKYYDVYEDCDDVEDKTEDYKSSDIFVGWAYGLNNDGVLVPILYKNDIESYGDEGADYGDTFYYVGTEEYNGTIYDKWRKIEDSNYGWDSTGKIWALTNVIVNSGSAVDPYFANSNLPAWEIKYCLDNDKTRFAWAKKGGYWVYTDLEDKTYILDEKITVGGQEYFTTTSEVILSIVPEPKTAQELYYYNGEEAITFEEDGSNIYDWGEDDTGKGGGKGVIYYMKDEWGNECPYDFKNIQFKRYKVTEVENEALQSLVYDEDGGQYCYYAANDWRIQGATVDTNDFLWCYTFMGCPVNADTEERGEWQDGSLESPYGHQSDEQTTTFVSNIIKPYIYLYDSENEDHTKCGVKTLNNIVLYGYWYAIGTSTEEYPYYYAYCCFNNKFGSDCHSITLNSCDSNTFGNNCTYNTFGNNCKHNTFGNYCFYNTFGNNCDYNTFGDVCTYNTFGNNCDNNTFGEMCDNNTFGYGCNFNIFSKMCDRNTFGDHCDSNTFGNNCTYNTFGNNCDSNTFGNYCFYNTLSEYAQYNIFENGVDYVALTSTTQGNYNNYLQNITVSQGVKGTTSSNLKTINATRNLAYKTTYVAQGSVTTEV